MALTPLLDSLPEIIRSGVEADPRLGYGLLALAMLLENVVPPIPSEVILPLAGFLVQQGQLRMLPAVLACLAGTVLGAWFWYGIGRLVNAGRLEAWLARRGGWLGVKPDSLAQSRAWFARHGAALIFWGRMVPGVRTLISVPAGVELMPQLPFLAWTTAGSLLWVVALTLAGRLLGASYGRVVDWLGPLSGAVKAVLLAGAALALLGWLWRRRVAEP
ncbi:MAG: DedA family protein [Synechococcaceae cyanobacterium]|nr:DedA family protein [Synechococcaceae cyanobacterium]